MSLVGKKAPLFTAEAVLNGQDFEDQFSLEQFVGDKNIILFFYPLDFTFVCPTELIEFQRKLNEFEARNTQVVGVSVDSKFSHWKWLQTEPKEGGIKGVSYPLVSDLSHAISESYQVMAGEWEYDENDRPVFSGVPVAYRALFLIDKQGVVRHQVVNDLPLGRNVDEALRMVDALTFFEENGEVCPANWKKGDDGMKPDAEGVANYLASH